MATMNRGQIRVFANLLAKNNGSVADAEANSLLDELYHDFWLSFADRVAIQSAFFTTGPGYTTDSTATPLEVVEVFKDGTIPVPLEIVSLASIRADIARSSDFGLYSAAARKVALTRKQNGSDVYLVTVFPHPGAGEAYAATVRKELTALSGDSSVPDVTEDAGYVLANMLALAIMELNNESLEAKQGIVSKLDPKYRARYEHVMRVRGRRADPQASEAGS